MKPTMLVIGLMGLIIAGCSQDSGFQSKPIESVNKGDVVFPPDTSEPDRRKIMCEAPRTQYMLNTEMVAFEITSRNKIKFGFDIIHDWFNLFKTSINVTSGRLDLDMDIRSTLQPKIEITGAAGSAKMSRKEFSFVLGIKQIAELGFEHYSETPLAELTSTGLSRALSGIRQGMNGKSEEWTAPVHYINHMDLKSELAIAAGATSGIKVGDEFAFYNLEHHWEGEPCKSQYKMRRRTSREPLAIGKVVELEDFSAIIELDHNSKHKARIKLGAQAVISKLIDSERRLRQPLLINKTEGGLLGLEDGSQADITPYLEKQIGTLAAQYGFIVYTK